MQALAILTAMFHHGSQERGMEDKDRRAAVLSALGTEHFVLQSAANGSMSEAGGRASLYLLSLSSTLVAMGFASSSHEIFVPFVATVLPAVFLLGVLTVLRLVDAAIEYNRYLTGIARVRAYYRTISPEAAVLFSPESGQWPEERVIPAARLGAPIALATTNASAVAVVNSIVGGAGVSLLAADRLGGGRTGLAVGLGVSAAIALLAIFFAYQDWRYTTIVPLGADASPGSTDPARPPALPAGTGRRSTLSGVMDPARRSGRGWQTSDNATPRRAHQKGHDDA